MAAPIAPHGVDLPVRDFTLENGMRFLVLERSAAPTVAFVVVFRVGGINETLGSTGTAHLLEHLLFKGSRTIGTRDVEAERRLFARMDPIHDTIRALRAATRADTARINRLQDRIAALEDSARVHVIPNEFDRILGRAGGRGLNATTGNEATTYFVELPANRAELWFALESDRMRDPVFREFYTERDVVMEERRLRVETSPGGLLYENHLAAAFTMHPYGVPVVGYMSDLENLGRDQVADYYRRFYGPGNAVVAVVGDVDADEIRAWAEAYFGDLEPGEEPAPVLAREPEQEGTRRVEVLFDAQPSLRLGWKVPATTHPDAPALAMLAALLTGSRSAHLQRELVETARVVTFVAAGLGPGDLHPQLFTLDLTPRSPHSPEEVEARVLAALEDFAESVPPEADLERVRNQIAAGNIRRLQNNLGLALQLGGSASAFGDWRTVFTLSDRIRDVTAEEVQAVARRYLRRETLTVGVVRSPGPETGS